MSYLVLARKWRPATFDEIVGQEHVTRALKNAIRLDRVAHAFLFTGARGVGKTTAARVLAKALQCEKGPTEQPCGTCRACGEIAGSNCVDVFEIDGASNRGINEIRELRDGVAYAPQRDRFKIYIIDEVHMLTQEAFNALLKTLEEPPGHVKFIFATTEPQKIPVTILSRCQRYDFKRVPLSQVKNHLARLIEREGVRVEEEGIRMMARESEGSVRDALSLLDRVLSYAGDEAGANAVAECLGIADRKWLHELLSAILGGETSRALGVVADVHQYGFDMRAFVAELLRLVRDTVVVHVCGQGDRAVDLSDAEAKALAQLSERHSVAALQRVFQIVLKAADDVATSRHPRLVLEMAVIRASTVLDMQSVPEVLERLEALERRLVSDEPPVRSQVAPQARGREPAPSPPTRTPGPPPRVGQGPSPLPARPEPRPASGVPDWPAFVASVKGSDPLLASMLEFATVEAVRGRRLTLGVGNDFYRSQLSAGPSHERLVELIRARLGLEQLEVARIEPGGTRTIAEERHERRATETAAREGRLQSDPMTRAVKDALDARVVDVRAEEVRDDD